MSPIFLFACASTATPGERDASNDDTAVDTADRLPIDTGTFVPDGLSYEEDGVHRVLDQVCGGCHMYGGVTSPPHSMEWSALVGVAAADVATLALVQPGSVDQSYLWHKIVGTQDVVGGEGELMPRDDMYGYVRDLETEERALVEQWIKDGAQP